MERRYSPTAIGGRVSLPSMKVARTKWACTAYPDPLDGRENTKTVIDRGLDLAKSPGAGVTARSVDVAEAAVGNAFRSVLVVRIPSKG